jgi:hypothetical protein
MSKFVLTAQLQLQAPTNTRQVISNLRRDLSGVKIPVEVKGAAEAKKQIDKVTAATKGANNAATNMGKSFGLAFKRFAAFTVASRAVSLFTNSMANAVEEALEFQKEMVKVSQVTGKSMRQLKGLERTIFQLSKTLGVSSKELLSTTRVLSQAGIKARELDVALTALAKTTLAPTFTDIAQTAEGAIAIMAQFKKGVGALEGQLGSINAVAGQFAVESGDLIGAIRRTGSVFKEAGGTLEEFLGLFTSVRATTRESAESIATGLRTIFTRIQRPKTIEFLRQFGVELTDLNGKFVGPYEAVRRLNDAIGGLGEGDVTFVKIAEEIAGFRQIGKVIPLLKEFEMAERARAAAIDGTTSLTDDAVTAQFAMIRQIMKVKQEFQELITTISQTTAFQAFVKTSLGLASALIKVADAISPLIPLMAAFAAFKFAKGVGGFASGLGGALRGATAKSQGGKILAFAGGGSVPGTGNRDTVPAMLTPGEFVMRKSSVKSMGASTLASMNANKYASGGTVALKEPEKYGAMVVNSKGGSDIQNAEVTGSASKYLNKLMRSHHTTQKTTPNVEASDRDIKKYANTLTADEQKKLGLELPGNGKKPKRYGGTGNPKNPGLKTRAILAQGFAAGGGLNIKPGEDLEYKLNGPFPVLGIGGKPSIKTDMNKEFEAGAKAALTAGADSVLAGSIPSMLNVGKPLNFADGENFKIRDVLSGASATMEGYLLEAVLGSIGDMKTQIADPKATGIRADFDFPNVTKTAREKLTNLFDPNSKLSSIKKADAKRTRSSAAKGDGRLVNKIAKDLKADDFIVKMANGGAVSDTVPALLTPGEFVINKSSSKSIGYGNLNKMNKSGVTGFNKGGAVGVQKFAEGGGVQSTVDKTKFSSSNAEKYRSEYDSAMQMVSELKDEQKGYEKQIAEAMKTVAKHSQNLAKISEERTKLEGKLADARANEDVAVKADYAATGAVSSAEGQVGAIENKKTAAKDNVGQQLSAVSGLEGNAKAAKSTSEARRGELAGAQSRVSTKMGKQGEGPVTKKQQQAAAQFAIITAELEKEEKAIASATKQIEDLAKAKKSISKAYIKTEKILDKELKESKDLVAAKKEAAKATRKEAKAAIAVTAAAEEQIKTHDKNSKQRVGTAQGAISKAKAGASTAKEGATQAKTAGGAFTSLAGNAKAGDAKQLNTDLANKRLKNLAGAGLVAITALNFLAPTIDENSSAFDKAFAGIVGGLNTGVTALGSLGFAMSAFGIQMDIATIKTMKNNAIDFFKGGTGGLGDKIGGKVSGGVSKVGNMLGKSKGGTSLLSKGAGMLGGAQKGAGGIATKVGGMLGGTGTKLGGMAMKTGGSLASAGASSAGAAASGAAPATAALAGAAGTAAAHLVAIAGPTIAMTAAVWGVTAAMDQLSGVNDGYTDAVKEGNIAKAGEAGLVKQNQKALSKFAIVTTAVGGVIGGIAGSIFGPVGTAIGAAIGALVGAIVGLIPKMVTLGPKLLWGMVKGIGSVLVSVGKWFLNIRGYLMNLAFKIPIIGGIFKKGMGILNKGFKKIAGVFSWVKGKIMSGVNAVVGAFNYLNDLTGGVLGKVAKTFMMLVNPVYMVYKAFTSFRDTFGWLLGMDSSAQVKAQHEAVAAMEIYTNGIEKNSKEQEKLVSDIKSGDSDQTFNQAMKEGDIGGNLQGALRAGKERKEASTMNFNDDTQYDWEGNLVQKTEGQVASDAQRKTIDGEKETDEQMEKRLMDTSGGVEGYREEDAKGMVASTKAIEDEFTKMKPQFATLSKNVALAGGETATFDDFLTHLPDDMKAGLDSAGMMDELETEFDKHKKAVVENIKYIEALNFGLRDAAGAANAMSVTMDAVANSQTAGFNNFGQSAAVLEKAMTSAGKNISGAQLDSALADLGDSMRTFGADEGQVESATGTIKGIQTAQGNTDAALAAAKAVLKEDASTSPDKVKDALGTELLKGVEGEARTRLQSALDKVDLEDPDTRAQIQAGNLDEILKQTLDPVAEAVTKEAIDLAKKRGEAEMRLVDAVKKRQAQELQYLAAQKSAIDTQLEAGKLFAEFGGASLTSEDKVSARSAQANLSLNNAGIGGLGGGGASEIKQAMADIKSSSIKQNDAANFGTLGMARNATDASGKPIGAAFAGASGVDEDKRDELKTANKALVDFTKQRIALIQEELKIAEQKNKAEKDSLDKLLGGDIEGFLDGQLASAAGSALKMGDAGVASAFGAGSLGAGYKTLEGQGLSDNVMQNAASMSLSSVGISDPRAAQVMSGTTSEQEALKGEGRELSQILGDAAQQGADLEQMDVNAAKVIINAQEIQMERFNQAPPEPGDAVPAGGMFRGGPVYANRGMFVPRGTDTVPAMLTPGEFVVNRSAVQAGNNLSLLKSMNGMGGAGGMGMHRGGSVYMAGGGGVGSILQSAGSSIMDQLSSVTSTVWDGMSDTVQTNVIDPMKKVFEDSPLAGFASQFQTSVEKLMDFQLSVKVDPTNVTVNFQGSNFMAGLKDDIKNELLEKVREELKGAKFNESGDLQSRPGNTP